MTPPRRPTLWDRLRHPLAGLSFLHENFALRNEPYVDAELGALLAELNRKGVARGLVAWPHVALERLARSASWGMARQRDLRVLKGLAADAGIFRRADARPLALLELTDGGFGRGKLAREKRLRKVLEGAGLPLLRWPRGEAPTDARVAALLDAVARGDVSAVTPLCPQCGAAMVRRVGKRNTPEEAPFWGCTAYPGCRGTRRIVLGEESGG